MSEEVQWTLGRVDAKLEFIVQLMEKHQLQTKELEARVGRLEARFWWAAGVAAAVVFSLNFILTKLGIKP